MLSKLNGLVYRGTKDILIDTGPLSLILFGAYDLYSIRKLKFRYTPDIDDLRILLQFLLRFRIVITPQVLAEVSNLVNTKIDKQNFMEFMKKNLLFMKKRLYEKHVPKDDILERTDEIKFGFTDASLLQDQEDKCNSS